ncbi:MAG: MFS transporter [Candidatus Dormibacteraeota bacterium]|nr:MFS transporter [Candidatus Dormibacteraeota bacterium]
MHRLTLGLLVGTHVVNDFFGGSVAVMVPFLIVERGYSYAAATGIVLASTFLASLVQPGFGVLTDRYRLGWLVGGGMLVCGLGVGVAGLTHSYVLTWLAIAISGVGSAAFHPEAARAARTAAGWSAFGMSLFSVGGNIGLAIAPIIVAAVLTVATLSGTPLLVAPAIVMAAVLAIVPRLARQAVAGTEPARPSRAPVLPRGADDWRMFGWLTGAVISLSIVMYGMRSFLPIYLVRHFGVSPFLGSTILTVLIGAGVAGTLLGGWLADLWGRVPVVRLGYACTLPALAGLLFAPTFWVTVAASIGLGLALFLPFSVHVTLGQEYLPGRLGTASGLTVGLTISAGGLASPLLGVLADARGIPAVLVVLMGVAVVALAFSSRFYETKRLAVQTAGSVESA